MFMKLQREQRYFNIFLVIWFCCASGAMATSPVEPHAERPTGYHPEYGLFYEHTKELTDTQLDQALSIFKMNNILSTALSEITEGTFVSHDAIALANQLRDAILALPEIPPFPKVLSTYCFCLPAQTVLHKVQRKDFFSIIDLGLKVALMQLHYVACYRYIEVLPFEYINLWAHMEHPGRSLQIRLDKGFANMRAAGISQVVASTFIAETSLTVDPAVYFQCWTSNIFWWEK